MTEKPASASHDLLIIQRGEPFSAKLQDVLHRKGFAYRQVNDPEQIEPVLPELADPILIIDCGSKPGAPAYVDLFVKPQLFEFPLLILGKDIEGLEDEMNRYFGLAVTLRAPTSPTDFLGAIRYISGVYRRESAEQKQKRLSERPEPPPETTVHEEEETLPLAQSHQLYTQTGSIPKLLFLQLKESGLFKLTLGGASYPLLRRRQDVPLADILPSSPQLKNEVTKLSDELGKWGAMHMYRTAFLTSRILRPLKFEESLKEAARDAALLFSYGFNNKNRTLLRKEYSGRGSILIRKEICSLIKDSALQLSTAFHLNQETKIVTTLGRLIGREEQVSDDPESIAASAVMAADLADRACFQSGNWNPRSAYALIRAIKAGKLRDFHPAVLCCLIKLMTEAVASAPPAHLLPKGIREDEQLIAQARRNREKEVATHEEKVELASLEPGMKLSQPLYAFDGRKLLSEDLTLDEDLIWRIWQLSSVRPINAPVVVQNKKAAEVSADAANGAAEQAPPSEPAGE